MGKSILLALLVFFTFSTTTLAAENNKFGIHLAQPQAEDIQKAAELVNGNGGDWGYITLIIQEDDRNKGKWQNVFDQLRQLHLIPIIRLATKADGDNWKRPTIDEAQDWANFLDSLNWVVKNRYIILFNEPNHASEWGGEVDPTNYKQVALEFARKLKAKNKDFSIMLAGFDASAPSNMPLYEDEENFLRQVFTKDEVDEWNSLLSGWSSHSYPNPGFTGSPYATGRGTITTYDWESNLLHSLGLKDLPVFITETGWDGDRLSRDTVAQYLQSAYENVWLPDKRVMAVTPFVLNYQAYPFLNFSFQEQGSDTFYPQYYTLQNEAKKAGDPEIVEKGEITADLPKELVVSSFYQLKVRVKNTGQGFWGSTEALKANEYKLRLSDNSLHYFFSDLSSTQPFQTTDTTLFIKTGTKAGHQEAKIMLYKKDNKILDGPTWQFDILPLPHLDFQVSLYPRLKHKGDDFEVQIFDKDEQLVYKQQGVHVLHTKGSVANIQNIALGRTYRAVILKPYYLPRQAFITFQKGNNNVVFKRMLPLDFNKDGHFDLYDIVALVQHPQLLSLWLP